MKKNCMWGSFIPEWLCVGTICISGDAKAVNHRHDFHSCKHPANWFFPWTVCPIFKRLLVLGSRKQVCKYGLLFYETKMLKIGRLLPLVMDVLKAFQQIHNFLAACVYKGTAHTEGFFWRAWDKCQDWVFFSSLPPWLWCKNFVFPKMRYNSPREKDE